MDRKRHIIGRTVLEIDSDRLDEVWSFQEEISDLLQQRVVPEMERLFDQWVGADEVIRLDQLVVEVAPVDRHWLADEFVRHLLEALNRTLGDRLINRLPAEVEAEPISRDRVPMAAEAEIISRDRAGADWEVLLYFLQYGRLPWWCLTEDWQNWIPRWEAVMQAGIHWQAPLRGLLMTHQVTRQRLVAQFPEGFRHQLVLQLQPTWIRWSNLLSQSRQLMQALGLSQSACWQLETQAWIILLSELGLEQSPDRPLPTAQWMQDWLVYLIRSWQPESMMESGQDLPLSSTTDSETKVGRKRGAQPKKRSGLRTKAHRRLRTLIRSIPIAERSLWLAALDRVIPRPLTAQTSAISSEAISENPESTVERTVEMPEVSDLNAPSDDISKTTGNSPLSPDEEAAGLFVNQSGLVILHPFLRLYFEDVGLLNGEVFRDEAAQQTAIYLLHYLATRQTDAPEYELVLPKLLCGWPLNEPLSRERGLPDAALAEGDNLLQAVINYWHALKSTSPDGLREGFLQREGKLTQLYEGDWRLQVEQKAIDILLGSLPWGFNVVKLPWMENLLMVEWN